MPEGRFKTTTVLIATKRRTRVFSSVDEVPPVERNRVDKAIHGELSRTILIADDEGYAQLSRREQERSQRRAYDSAAMRFAVKASAVGVLLLLAWIILMLRG